MRLNKIFKILFSIAVLLGLLDFILYFITFSKIYEKIGGYLALIIIPLGLLLFIVNVVLWLKAKDRKVKFSYRFNSILILFGFGLLVFLCLLYFNINKHSRLTIQNSTKEDLTEVQISSLPDKSIIKSAGVIKSNNHRKFLLNKFQNHEWEIRYKKGKMQIIDTIKYHRYFRYATNDKLIVTKDGLIDQMFETQIIKEN